MFSIFYKTYKWQIWMMIALLLISGVVSKISHGRTFEAILDGVLALISLLYSLSIRSQQRKERD